MDRRLLIATVICLLLAGCIGRTLEEMNRPYGTSGPGLSHTEEELDP